MKNVKYTDSAHFHCLENLRETSLDLSLVHTGKEHCKPFHVFSGVREEYIIHFVLSGSGFYSANGNTYPLTGGQMFLIYPGTPVTYGADENDPWSYAWIGFNGIRTDNIIKECGFSKNKLVLPAPKQEDFMECINNILNHRLLTFSNDLYRESALLMLFSILIEHHTMLNSNGKSEKYSYSSAVYAESAMDYIKTMYKTTITVQDVADNLGISRAHLNQSFQKELGMSVQRFLIDYRMHKAANLLVSTSLSVKEISNSVGYDDQLIFPKKKKKKFGISPKNYKTHTDTVDRFKEKQI